MHRGGVWLPLPTAHPCTHTCLPQSLEKAATALYYRALLNWVLLQHYAAEAPGAELGVGLRRPPASAQASFPAYAAWAIEQRLGLPLRPSVEALEAEERKSADAVRPGSRPRPARPARHALTLPLCAAAGGGAPRRRLPPRPGPRCRASPAPGPAMVRPRAGMQRQPAPRLRRRAFTAKHCPGSREVGCKAGVRPSCRRERGRAHAAAPTRRTAQPRHGHPALPAADAAEPEFAGQWRGRCSAVSVACTGAGTGAGARA